MTARKKRPAVGDFRAAEPWRVLRIASELVSATEDLGELGAAITIFGGSRVAPDTAPYS